MAYTSFQGTKLQLYPWVGSRIAVLTRDLACPAATMQTMVATLDRALDFYANATGRLPELYLHHQGRGTIASVAATCGAGCGYLGYTGIELMNDVFDRLCGQITASNLYDQAVFYELGRNFWFYGPKIEYLAPLDTGSVTTGYAVGMRFLAMEAAGAAGAPFGVHDFAFFRREVESLADRLRVDPSLTWENTLKIGRAPTGGVISLGGTDLFASIFLRLNRVHGPAWIKKVWKRVAQRPNAATTQDAVDNFVIAASEAAGVNLVEVFIQHWKWPVSAAVRARLAQSLPISADLSQYL